TGAESLPESFVGSRREVVARVVRLRCRVPRLRASPLDHSRALPRARRVQRPASTRTAFHQNATSPIRVWWPDWRRAACYTNCAPAPLLRSQLGAPFRCEGCPRTALRSERDSLTFPASRPWGRRSIRTPLFGFSGLARRST